MPETPWWRATTVYQIYPRSFFDSNDDGIGDLEGIRLKLDYLHDLGVETIWLSPPYKSPQKDFGYDISDYRDIAPEYGTMDTMDRLIEDVHGHDMKIMLDMVLNHTSDEHPWFIKSKSSRDNPKRDWYIWRDGKKPDKKHPGGKKPPTNWNAVTTRNGWHYDPATTQWYWSQFLDVQPDLNYRNPEVKAEMLDTCRFWLEKGADGFRLDMISSIYEDAEFRDNPCTWRLIPSEKDSSQLFQKPVYTLDHPDTFAFMKELRSVIDEFEPPRFMVGEVAGPLPILRKYLGDEQADGLNLVFMFQSLGLKMKASAFKSLLQKAEQTFVDPYETTWVFSNHDRMRRISRFRGGSIKKAKLNMAFQLTARGVPFIYQGEEIGMENHNLNLKETLDIVPRHLMRPTGKLPVWFAQPLNSLAKSFAGESLNRDECRTPVQWDDSENAGFCPAGIKPWLPVTPSYKVRNVASESADANSILHCYERFLKARRDEPALNSGSLTVLTKGIPSAVLAYTRSAPGHRTCGVFLNFASRVTLALVPEEFTKLVVSTRTDRESILQKALDLGPWEGVVVA
jgi:oligo-1,6-glucosidase/alpha-glucosidase